MAEPKPLSVYSMSGKCIYLSKGNETNLALSLDKGIYIVRIENEAKKVVIR